MIVVCEALFRGQRKKRNCKKKRLLRSSVTYNLSMRGRHAEFDLFELAKNKILL